MTRYDSLTQARKNMDAKEIQRMIHKAHAIAKEFRQKETELINILQELDASKAYRATGYNSLFQFCVESLELTEHQAYQYITVARKCIDVPELMVALEDQRITVSKARKLSSVIAPENQESWIQLASTHSQKDLEKAVRAQCPLPPVRDHLQVLSKDEVKLQATIDRETTQMLERVIEILGEQAQFGRRININDSLKTVCGEYLKKYDPVKRAERALAKTQARKQGQMRQQPTLSVVKSKGGKDQLGENRVLTGSEAKAKAEGLGKRDQILRYRSGRQGHSQHSSGRRALPMELKHQVMFRDQGQCRFHRNGQRCENRRYLEIHHKKPLSQGGSDKLENLVLLCSEHHKTVHLCKPPAF